MFNILKLNNVVININNLLFHHYIFVIYLLSLRNNIYVNNYKYNIIFNNKIIFVL